MSKKIFLLCATLMPASSTFGVGVKEKLEAAKASVIKCSKLFSQRYNQQVREPLRELGRRDSNRCFGYPRKINGAYQKAPEWCSCLILTLCGCADGMAPVCPGYCCPGVIAGLQCAVGCFMCDTYHRGGCIDAAYDCACDSLDKFSTRLGKSSKRKKRG